MIVYTHLQKELIDLITNLAIKHGWDFHPNMAPGGGNWEDRYNSFAVIHLHTDVRQVEWFARPEGIEDAKLNRSDFVDMIEETYKVIEFLSSKSVTITDTVAVKGMAGVFCKIYSNATVDIAGAKFSQEMMVQWADVALSLCYGDSHLCVSTSVDFPEINEFVINQAYGLGWKCGDIRSTTSFQFLSFDLHNKSIIKSNIVPLNAKHIGTVESNIASVLQFFKRPISPYSVDISVDGAKNNIVAKVYYDGSVYIQQLNLGLLDMDNFKLLKAWVKVYNTIINAPSPYDKITLKEV